VVNGQSEIWDKYIKVYIYGLEKKYSAAKNGYFSMEIVSYVNKHLHIIYSSILTKWVKITILMV